MSLYKRCRCPSWKCDHHWAYRFRLNGRNYRATTQTALKRQALDFLLAPSNDTLRLVAPPSLGCVAESGPPPR